MALIVTYHGRYRPADINGALVDVLGPQVGNAFVVADDAVETDLSAGFYEIEATSDCVVRVGEKALPNAAGGRGWAAGKERVYHVPGGGCIACDAVA